MKKKNKKNKRRGKGSPRKTLERKANKILKTGKIRLLDDNKFKVPAQSTKNKYYQIEFLDVWTCTCPYNVQDHGDCKHIIAAQKMLLDVPEIKPIDFTMTMPEVACTKSNCGSTNCKYVETRPTKSGESKRYLCLVCKNKFTYRPFALGTHYSLEFISNAIDDVCGGKSYDATAQGLKKRSYSCLKTTVDKSTISRWVKKARDATAELSKKIPIRVSGKWHTDEIYYKFKNKKMWRFTVMDSESRLIITHTASKKKFGYDATELFQDAVDTAKSSPRALVSDKLHGFTKGYKKVICAKNNNKDSPTIHIKSKLKDHKHICNNLIERLNGTIRCRFKTTRGFKSEDPPLHGLFITYYNFIRPHTSLNKKTPGEVMGIKIQGPNTWATLLAYAAVHC